MHAGVGGSLGEHFVGRGRVLDLAGERDERPPPVARHSDALGQVGVHRVFVAQGGCAGVGRHHGLGLPAERGLAAED